MEKMQHRFLNDLEIGPDNGLFSTDFMHKYNLSFKEVLIPMADLERQKLISLKDCSSMNGRDFIATITTAGSRYLFELNQQFSLAKSISGNVMAPGSSISHNKGFDHIDDNNLGEGAKIDYNQSKRANPVRSRMKTFWLIIFWPLMITIVGVLFAQWWSSTSNKGAASRNEIDFDSIPILSAKKTLQSGLIGTPPAGTSPRFVQSELSEWHKFQMEKAAYESWEFASVGIDSSIYFVRTTNARKFANGKLNVWAKAVSPTSEYDGESYKNLYRLYNCQFDCSRNKFKLLKCIIYTELGKELSSIEPGSDEEEPLPESIIEKILRTACTLYQ